MYSAALTLNTPTGPLPVMQGQVVAYFEADGDPTNAKRVQGFVMDESFGAGRARLISNDPPEQGASSGNILYCVPGYKVISGPTRQWIGFQPPEWGTVELEPSVPPFPPEVDPFLGPITPFDPSDSGGTVWTVLPDEAVPVWQPPVKNRNVWRGDFGGVTTPLAPPYVDGANTTPPNMWMSFFLPKYAGLKMPDGSDCQTYYLTEYVKRGYTHFVLTRPDDLSPSGIAAFVALCQLVQSFGLYVVYWASGSGDPRDSNWATLGPTLFDPVMGPLIAAKAMDICIVGEELNSWNVPGPTGLDTIINGVCALTNPADIPTYLHFTDNYFAWQPEAMSASDWWAMFTGTTAGYGTLAGLCMQLNPYESAGTQSARFWYGRQCLGTANGYGFLVVAFEIMATAQLYGQADETTGRRRGYEMCCGVRDGLDYVPPPAGFCNGGSYGDGRIM